MTRCDKAFTMIEMLVAVLISAMLMSGVLAVVANIGSSGFKDIADRSDNGELDFHTRTQLVKLLREDLELSSWQYAAADELVLLGYCSLDSAGCDRVHRPVMVRYGFEIVAGTKWFVRRQIALDELTNKNIRRELVCKSLSGFELTSYDAEPSSFSQMASDSEILAELEDYENDDDNDSQDDGDDDGGSAMISVVGYDEYESVLYKGLMFYRKYLPKSLRYSDGAGDPNSGNFFTNSPDGQNVGSDAGDKKAKILQDMIYSSWQLKLFSGDGRELVYDATVAITPKGQL